MAQWAWAAAPAGRAASLKMTLGSWEPTVYPSAVLPPLRKRNTPGTISVILAKSSDPMRVGISATRSGGKISLR